MKTAAKLERTVAQLNATRTRLSRPSAQLRSRAWNKIDRTVHRVARMR